MTTGVPLDDVVLVFDETGSLTNRYLHGPAVDQVFADEDAMAEILWGLGDNQGTIRDVADHDAGTDTTSIANHRQFDSFGNLTGETNATVEFAYAYTGRYLDPDTGLGYNRARWYDPAVGRWLSEDPIGFAAGQMNLAVYVGNGATYAIDPSELERGTWGPGGWWWLNPWSYSGPRHIVNLITGNSDFYGYDEDLSLNAQERELWERGRQLGRGSWQYDIYYQRYYRRPIPEGVRNTIQEFEVGVAGMYGGRPGGIRPSAGRSIARGAQRCADDIVDAGTSARRGAPPSRGETRYVFDARAGRYRDVATGRFVAPRDLPWPSNAGFASSTRRTIWPGTILDRYGNPSGRFLGTPGSTISQRGMAPGTESLPYARYRVLRPFEAQVGPAAEVPEFGAAGGALQYLPRNSVQWLIDNGYLEVIND